MTLTEIRRAHGHALFWFTAVNCVLAFLNGTGYLGIAGLDAGSTGWLFAALAMWGQLSLVCLVAGLFFYTLAGVGPAFALPRYLAPLIFGAFHFLLFVDKLIYALFRFHWNGLVWNVLMTPGGWESMHLTTADMAKGVTGLLLAIAVEYAFFGFLVERFKMRSPRRGSSLGRRWAALAVLVLLSYSADHVIYAVCDMRGVREVTRNAKVIPFYQPFTVKKLARKFGVESVDREDVRVGDSTKSFLDYPKAALQAELPAKLFNVVWIVIDGWRADAFTPEATPNLWALGKRSQVFQSHWSGGNATRFGIFSMLYGLYGTYWHNFLNEQRGPVLVDRLNALGYQSKVLSSTSLTFPEFRRTAFVAVPDAIEDALAGEGPAERDAEMVARFSAFLDGRKDGVPFFGFLFGDATHAGYQFPKDAEKFKPFTPGLEYLKMGSKADPELPHNRYLNAVYYSDRLAGQVIKDLEKRGLMKDTILLVTGDHGEEFHEHGLWGHNGNFSKEQIQVPLIVYVPGKAPKRLTLRTSHHDLAPTFMELLGVRNPPSDYSLGAPLFRKEERPYEVGCSWDQCALLTPKTTIVFGTESHGVGGVDVFDADYKDVEDRKGALAENAAHLASVLAETTKFLKK